VGRSYRELFVEIADFSVWLSTFAGKLTWPLGVRRSEESDQETVIRIDQDCAAAMWSRYPGICPSCYWRRTNGGETSKQKGIEFSRPCDCELLDIEPESANERITRAKALRSYSERNKSARPSSIDHWQLGVQRIYSAQLNRMSVSNVMALLLEKAGKVSDALVRTYTYSDKSFVPRVPATRRVLLEEQVADLFMCAFLLIERLNLMRAIWHESYSPTNALRLSSIVWSRYGSDSLGTFICPHCSKARCTCNLIIVPVHRSKDELTGLN